MLNPPPVTTRVVLVVAAIIYAVTSINSVTFFHPDEHYQVLEFAGYKLGFTPERELPWEFAVKIRPYFQATLCQAIVNLLQSIGVSDRFAFAAALRLFFSAFYWVSLLMLHRSKLNLVGPTTASLACLMLAGFQPYLAARTSSDTFATSLFIAGASMLVGFTGETRPTSMWRTALGTLLLGLAFQARFQTAILTVGAFAWCTLRGRPNRINLFLGSLCGFGLALVIGLVCDRFGYGEWCLPAVGYFKANLLEGVASRYGTSPVFAYLYLLPANVFAPLVVLLMVSLVFSWLRYPGAAITWIGLPFFLVHSLIGHKEERFLFPLIPFAIVGMCAVFVPSQLEGGWHGGLGQRMAARLDSTLAWFWARRTGYGARAIAFLSTAGMLLLMLYPLGWRPHHRLHEWVAASHPEQVTFILDGTAPPNYPFFRTGSWNIVARSPQTCEGLLLRNSPFEQPEDHCGKTPRLVYSEFPGWNLVWVRDIVFPRLQRLLAQLSPKFVEARARWYSVYEL